MSCSITHRVLIKHIIARPDPPERMICALVNHALNQTMACPGPQCAAAQTEGRRAGSRTGSFRTRPRMSPGSSPEALTRISGSLFKFGSRRRRCSCVVDSESVIKGSESESSDVAASASSCSIS
jgi:hypothetical protein